MIVKRNLSARRVIAYTARPMAWAAGWAVAAPVAYELSDDARLALPFPPIAALAGALAIVVAFRNSAALGRWNEARAAWQSVLVASRTLARQVHASTASAADADAIDEATAVALRHDVADHLVAFAWALEHRVRPDRRPTTGPGATAGPTRGGDTHANPPDAILVSLATRIKAGIRSGALGQFDPISLEPQLVALGNAQGTVERIASTPTPRSYDYFTRQTVALFAALVPFSVLGLVPGSEWIAAPLGLAVSGTYVVLAVAGAVNDVPFASAVTDVPIDSVCTQIEHELRSALGEPAPPLLQPVDGYLW